MRPDRSRLPAIWRTVSKENESNRGGVMPTLKPEEFCEAFYTWAEACQTELPTDDADKKQWRIKFADHWSFIELAFHKSCLLDRLIYAREPLRTEMCPRHKGKWSGCVFEKLECGCQFGSNVTGWLVPPEQEKGS
jgi:hypothetical protein